MNKPKLKRKQPLSEFKSFKVIMAMMGIDRNLNMKIHFSFYIEPYEFQKYFINFTCLFNSYQA